MYFSRNLMKHVFGPQRHIWTQNWCSEWYFYVIESECTLLKLQRWALFTVAMFSIIFTPFFSLKKVPIWTFFHQSFWKLVEIPDFLSKVKFCYFGSFWPLKCWKWKKWKIIASNSTKCSGNTHWQCNLSSSYDYTWQFCMRCLFIGHKTIFLSVTRQNQEKFSWLPYKILIRIEIPSNALKDNINIFYLSHQWSA